MKLEFNTKNLFCIFKINFQLIIIKLIENDSNYLILKFYLSIRTIFKIDENG